MRYRLMYRLHDDRKVQTNVASAIKEYKQVNGKKLPKSARNLGMWPGDLQEMAPTWYPKLSRQIIQSSEIAQWLQTEHSSFLWAYNTAYCTSDVLHQNMSFGNNENRRAHHLLHCSSNEHALHQHVSTNCVDLLVVYTRVTRQIWANKRIAPSKQAPLSGMAC